jgi:hypothetical protein
MVMSNFHGMLVLAVVMSLMSGVFLYMGDPTAVFMFYLMAYGSGLVVISAFAVELWQIYCK